MNFNLKNKGWITKVFFQIKNEFKEFIFNYIRKIEKHIRFDNTLLIYFLFSFD